MEPDVKIEIGESLIHSWLPHVQGCTVTQASWKPSPTWTMARERELKETFEVIRKFASETIGVQIFKERRFQQFLRGGSRRPGSSLERSHGGAERDRRRLRVSRIRLAVWQRRRDGRAGPQEADPLGICARGLSRRGRGQHNLRNAKMAEPIREAVQRHLATLEVRIVEQRGSAMARLRFRVIANTEFADEILAPVLGQVDAVADTSELFMRSAADAPLRIRPPESSLIWQLRSSG
jgi:hypothetical protein